MYAYLSLREIGTSWLLCHIWSINTSVRAMLHLSLLSVMYWKGIALKLQKITYCSSCHLHCLLIQEGCHTNRKYSKRTHVLSQTDRSYANIVGVVTFGSTRTKRSWAEADPVSIRCRVRLHIHCQRLTNRGLQCITELLTTTPLWLFTVCRPWRQKQRGRTDFYGLGLILDLFKEWKGDVTSYKWWGEAKTCLGLVWEHLSPNCRHRLNVPQVQEGISRQLPGCFQLFKCVFV